MTEEEFRRQQLDLGIELLERYAAGKHLVVSYKRWHRNLPHMLNLLLIEGIIEVKGSKVKHKDTAVMFTPQIITMLKHTALTVDTMQKMYPDDPAIQDLSVLGLLHMYRDQLGVIDMVGKEVPKE